MYICSDSAHFLLSRKCTKSEIDHLTHWQSIGPDIPAWDTSGHTCAQIYFSYWCGCLALCKAVKPITAAHAWSYPVLSCKSFLDNVNLLKSMHMDHNYPLSLWGWGKVTRGAGVSHFHFIFWPVCLYLILGRQEFPYFNGSRQDPNITSKYLIFLPS